MNDLTKKSGRSNVQRPLEHEEHEKVEDMLSRIVGNFRSIRENESPFASTIYERQGSLISVTIPSVHKNTGDTVTDTPRFKR